MKHSFVDRLLSGLAGLVLTILGIGLFVYGLGIFPFQLDLAWFSGPFTFWQHVLMVLAALVLFLLGVWGLSKVFRSGKEKGFILQRTEYGDLNISMNAMENMVKKCVDMNDELKVTQTKIIHTRDGVIVSIRIMLENGVNIPMIVSALQKQTKQYITSCSGVDVKMVRVYVETSNNMGLKHKSELPSEMTADVNAVEKAGRMVDRLNESVQKAIQTDAAPVQKEEKKDSLHQRIFRKKDDEQDAALYMPPAEKPETDAPADAQLAEDPAAQAEPDKKTGKQTETTDPHDKENV